MTAIIVLNSGTLSDVVAVVPALPTFVAIVIVLLSLVIVYFQRASVPRPDDKALDAVESLAARKPAKENRQEKQKITHAADFVPTAAPSSTSLESFENSIMVCLERKPAEAWGFAWHVRAYAQKRFLIAGLDPNSPAGRWGQEMQAKGLPSIGRGDELVSANWATSHGTIRRELVVADKVSLRFLRATDAPKKESTPVAEAESKAEPKVVSKTLSPKSDCLHVQEENTEGFRADYAVLKSSPKLEPVREPKELKLGSLLPAKNTASQVRSISQTAESRARRLSNALLGSQFAQRAQKAFARSRSDPPPVSSASPNLHQAVSRNGSTSPYQSGCLAGIEWSLALTGKIKNLDNTTGSSSGGDWDCVKSYAKQISIDYIQQSFNREGAVDSQSNDGGLEPDRDKDSNIFSSSGGSGSELPSDKCPSTDWEYMMDNRMGSMMMGGHPHPPGIPTTVAHRHSQAEGRTAVPGSASNLVIVAGSQALALQTAAALGTVLAGGVLPRASDAAVSSTHPAAAPVPAPVMPPHRLCEHSHVLPPPPSRAPRTGRHMSEMPTQVQQLPPAFSGQQSAVPSTASNFMIPDPRLVGSWPFPPQISHGVPNAALQLPMARSAQRAPAVAAGWAPSSQMTQNRARDVSVTRASRLTERTSSSSKVAGRSSGRADSAPPACGPAAPSIEGPVNAEPRRKKTYRAGQRITARRIRAAHRAEREAAALPSESAGNPHSGRRNIAPTAATNTPTVPSAPLTTRRRTLRSESAPPVCGTRSLDETTNGAAAPAQATTMSGRLYYKPRRRAGVRVRQRMEVAMARRREAEVSAPAEPRPIPPRIFPSNMSDTSSDGVRDMANLGSSIAIEAFKQSRLEAGSTASTTVNLAPSVTGSEAMTASKQRRSFYPSKATALEQSQSERVPTSKTGSEVSNDQAAQRLRVRSRTSDKHVATPAKRGRERFRAEERVQSASPASNPMSSDDLVGQSVLITGLKQSPQFNGRWGLVDAYDATMQRYVVQVFMGEPGASPVTAKLRRESLVVPVGCPPKQS